MAYISPNTTIKICKNVALDSDYRNTINFNDASSQYAFFNGKVKYTQSNYTYQRIRKNILRIAINADNLYDCNYMMFQNTSFGAKWFYAFITNVEYVNNETSEITFELDYIQTYLFDIVYKKCYIERQHSRYDNIYFNHQPEDYTGSEFIENTTQHISEGAHYYGVLITELPDSQQFPSNLVRTYRGYANGVACGLWLIYNIQSQAVLGQVFISIEQSTNIKLDAVVSVFRYPSKYAQTLSDTNLPYSQLHTVRIPTSLNGYTPRNKKLLQYPYNFLRLQTANNENVDLRYERFNNPVDGIIEVHEYGAIYPTVEGLVVPYEYEYSGTGNNSYSFKISLDSSVQVGMTGDSYRDWLSSNKLNLAISAISAVLQGLRNPVNMIERTGQLANTLINKSAMSNKEVGSAGNGIVDSAIGNDGFYIKQVCIESDEAIAIDNYFTKYGYTANVIDYPNRRYRPNFNYIKTRDCCLTGGCPNEALRRIEQAFNDGITWWNNGDNIGDYDLNNSPT